MTSTAPAVVDYLVAVFRAAIVDVDVIDGPDVSGASLPKAITIGFEDEDAGAIAIDGAIDREGFGPSSREGYTINCACAVVAADVASGRRDAFALFRLVCDVLRGDPTLGGTVLAATVATFTLTQTPDLDRGLVVRVIFGLEVDAYTQES